MPYYDLICPNCGFTTILKGTYEEATTVVCPNCGNILRIVIYPVPFFFKEPN